MADEPKSPRRRTPAAEKPAAEKPARTRAASKKPDAAAADKAPRTRAAAKPAAEKEAATQKPARTRAASKKPDDATAAKAPRARARARAKAPAAAAEAATPTAEATKPARRRPAPKPASSAPAPAPAPARTRRSRPTGPVTVRAQARYVRSSARKARLVCDHIRGKSVPEARALLAFAPRGVAKDWAKLLDSAVANAENNHELVGDELRVTAVYADEGPTLKRFRPRAMGRATPIHKRTSHLTILIGTKE
jgi:ribosomal protein L22